MSIAAAALVRLIRDDRAVAIVALSEVMITGDDPTDATFEAATLCFAQAGEPVRETDTLDWFWNNGGADDLFASYNDFPKASELPARWFRSIEIRHGFAKRGDTITVVDANQSDGFCDNGALVNGWRFLASSEAIYEAEEGVVEWFDDEFDRRVREKIQASLDDLRPSVPHDDAMALIRSRIHQVAATGDQ